MATPNPHNSHKEISKSTLGRNMEVGMLYDCCTDSPITADFAWSKEELGGKGYELKDPSTKSNFIKENESEDTKMVRHFQTDASLKASIVSGLVTLGGAANYLNDNTQTSQVSRRILTFHYKTTTREEKISLKDMTSPNVRNHNATHVVTGVTYGVNVFLVFYDESAITQDSRKKDLRLRGDLKIAITKQIENKNDVSVDNVSDIGYWSDEEIFSCELYGDFISTQTPTNFKEALRFCHKLPTLCETGVSVRVTLTPLSFLISGHAIVKEIDHRLLSKFVNNMNALERISESCQTLMQHTACVQFPSYRTLIHKYFHQISSYRDKFKYDVKQLLPEIRRGVVNPSKLREAVTRVEKSPFMPERFNRWIKSRKKELRDLEGLLEHLPGIHVVETPEDFKYVVTDPSKEKVYCFALPSILHEAGKYLAVLKQYTNSEDPGDNNSPPNVGHFALDFKRNAFVFYQENGVSDTATFVVTSFVHNEITIQKKGSFLLFTGRDPKGSTFIPPNVKSKLCTVM